MTPFLKSVADYLYNNYRDNLHTLAVVFPNKRARIFFNQYLSEFVEKPVFAPKYYTIIEYMQEISGRNVADQLTLLFELYEVYKSVTNSEELFDDFLFYCEMLLADFDDIDKYLVDPKLLFQNLADLKELDAYYEFLDDVQIKAIKQFWEAFSESKDSPEKDSFSKIWDVLYRIYKEFHNILEQKDIASEGSAYRKAIDELKTSTKEAPGSKVVFVGFNALNKCEKELFGYLKNQKRADFFWDYDNYYLNRQEFHEAAWFLKDLVRNFPSPTGFNFESELISEDKNIKVYDITTNTGQAKILPEIINDLPSEWNLNPVKTAIALADETLLMPVLGSIPDSVQQVNISMGYPLKETSIYSLSSILLDLQRNKRILSDGREQYYYQDVLRILQNGLISNLRNSDTEQLISNIKKFNLVYVDSEKLSFSNDLLTAVYKKGIDAHNFVPYLIEILEKIPQLVYNQSEQIYMIEGEAAFRVVTRLRRISDILSQSKIDYSFKSLVRLVGKVLQGETVPFSGEPLNGMQIMGILETRTLDFDNLIVLSMNEGVFPKSGHVPSFIPYNLRKAFDLPTIEHQDAIFAYYFYRLLQRAKNITLVYTSSVQDTKSGEPSRFIHQLNYEKSFKLNKQTIGYHIFPISRKNVIIQKSANSRKVLLEKYGGENKRLLSPSAINTYLNCNLRFYYRYIAGLKEPENVLEEVEANTLGSILHKAIEKLYLSVGKKIIDKTDLIALRKNTGLVSEEVLKAFWSEYLAPTKEYPGNDEVPISGKNILVKEVIVRYIESIIDYDLKKVPFEIKGLEDEFAFDFSLNDGTNIATGGIIDRLDRYDGTIRVIDYKSGKQKNSFKNIDDLFDGESSKRNDAAFQTLLYSLVVSKKLNEKDIEPGLYFVRNMRDKNYNHQLKISDHKKTSVNSIKDTIDDFEERLIQTLNEIFSTSGTFAQTEDEKYCEYCPFIKMCSR